MLGIARLFSTAWTVAHQAPLSMAFPGRNAAAGCQGAHARPSLQRICRLSTTSTSRYVLSPLGLGHVTQFGLTVASWALPCPWPLNMAIRSGLANWKIFQQLTHIQGKVPTASLHVLRRGVHFQAPSRGDQQGQLLAGCWTEGLSSSLAAGHRGPPSSFHSGRSPGQLTARQLDLLGAEGQRVSTVGSHFCTSYLLGIRLH